MILFIVLLFVDLFCFSVRIYLEKEHQKWLENKKQLDSQRAIQLAIQAKKQAEEEEKQKLIDEKLREQKIQLAIAREKVNKTKYDDL
jgi:hypothetical protein